MKTTLIYGISGQDGAFLSRLLLEKGYRVIGVSRNAYSSSFSNLKQLGIYEQIEIISSSVQDFRNVIKVITEYRPDEIYNLAGQSSVAQSFDMPFETFESISVANLNLLEVLRMLKTETKFYNAGSGDCFGNIYGDSATESTPFNPRSPYGVAKAAAFWQVANYREAYDIFACTGILFNHESYLRPDYFVTRKIVKTACRIAQGSEETLSLGNITIERDWGWAPEYVNAMWRMLQQERPGDYIIATGKSYSLESFIDAVFSHLNLNWQDHVVIDQRFIRPTDIQSIKANPNKAERNLTWKAHYDALDVARMMVEAQMACSHGIIS